MGDEEIETTEEHPFYVEETGWVAAGDLKEGDVIRTSEGEKISISKVEIEKIEGTVYVYNFEVEDYHTYYVFETSVLVHNQCWTKYDDIGGSNNFGNYTFKEGIDVDLRGQGSYKDALDMAFENTGLSKEHFNVTKWGKDKNGKSFPVEWRADNGAEVNIDLGHSPTGEAPTIPHIGWQTGGKRGSGGAVRGHIFVDYVPYNR